MLRQLLNENLSTCMELSTLPCPLAVAGGRQGLMHSHSPDDALPGHALYHVQPNVVVVYSYFLYRNKQTSAKTRWAFEVITPRAA